MVQEKEAKFIVLPPDGSSDSEGASDEDMEDDLYAEEQAEVDSSSGDRDLNGSSSDEAEEGANQNRQEKRGTMEFR